MSTVYDRARPRSGTIVRVEQLLARYPNLCEQELAELINLYPYLNMVARGLIAADERLGDNLETFYRDHGEKLDGFVLGRTPLVAFVALGMIFVLWLILS